MKYLRMIIGLLFVALFVSCEDSGGGGAGDGHDFGDNDSNLYVAMGDSITEGYQANTSYPQELSAILGKNVVNRGIGGTRSSEGAAAVRGVLSRYRPGYLLIDYGANDAIHGVDYEETISNLRYMIRVAKDNKTVPVIATLTPMYWGHVIYDGHAGGLSDRIKILASEEGAYLVDVRMEFSGHMEYMQSDGLHPNDTGLRAMAMAFADVLK